MCESLMLHSHKIIVCYHHESRLHLILIDIEYVIIIMLIYINISEMQQSIQQSESHIGAVIS